MAWVPGGGRKYANTLFDEGPPGVFEEQRRLTERLSEGEQRG